MKNIQRDNIDWAFIYETNQKQALFKSNIEQSIARIRASSEAIRHTKELIIRT